jgi:prepilin-type N-terminal cleavage/methylation domain-containing protein
MVKRGSSRRGFTLIELLVTSAVAIIMLSAALALFVQSITLQQRQRKLAEMKRSAALVMGMLTTELRQAGLGRPRGSQVVTGDRFAASILVAEDHRIAFLADLPRIDSTFNGYSQLAANQAPSTFQGVSLLNELNGGCDVTTDVTRCTTNRSSHLFPYNASLQDVYKDCADKPDAARTCPWALKRYRSGEYIIVADGMGRWVERQVSSSSTPWGPRPSSNRQALLLDGTVPEQLASDGNQGFASTPDRVFHRLTNGQWERNQCWGSVGNAGSDLLTVCGAGAAGTGWEKLARMGAPQRVTFKYFKRDGSPLTAPVTGTDRQLISRVDIELQFERSISNSQEPLRHSAHGSITLRQ